MHSYLSNCPVIAPIGPLHMPHKYLLPCSCGASLSVEASQAGEDLHCHCGAKLEVPTMRGLAELERIEIDDREPTWSRRQGTLFVCGVIWLCVGALITYWLSWLMPPVELSPRDTLAEELSARPQSLTPVETLQLWRLYRESPVTMYSLPARRAQRDAMRQIVSVVVGGAGCITLLVGFGLMAAAFFLKPRAAVRAGNQVS